MDQGIHRPAKGLTSGIKATPIYLLVLRAQEEGNEPFWNKKKS